MATLLSPNLDLLGTPMIIHPPLQIDHLIPAFAMNLFEHGQVTHHLLLKLFASFKSIE
jgi:hypothetical protein